ncbi:IclR family transcriptional regulator [Spirochaeta isovalerica]|uniref:DNA-binding IclR family transcriptional regulator n=1 Tax=Spirochaeta isovalerica TaxID=150 RepID=A0A841RBW1_9SPIO|nr:IclR family transcriptional regulator [Spirochaeta isovalerica]MBB6480717.1 DNA-binding IclR family transcriptional regulator [Spirochaeta isovalerica]
MEKQNSAVPALDKMDLIFDLLTRTPEGLSQSVIASELQLPKATVSRMINRLTGQGYLEQDHLTGLYNLGAKLLTLGNIVNQRLDVAALAAPHMKELAREIDEMVKLSIMRGDTVYPLCSFESRKAVRITLDSGTVYPPYIGAAGKLLLALTEEGRLYRQNVLPSIVLKSYSPYTIADKAKLEEVIDRIAVEKIAYDHQEESEGIYAIAMPVFNSLGETAGAVSIPFFGDFESKSENYKSRLKACTDMISRSMGYERGKVYE